MTANTATSKRILVIDDDPAFLRLVEKVLARHEFKVLKTTSGSEGLRLLFAEKPDLVILDVVMPSMNGWQACQRIRELTDIPIIIITGKQKAESDVVHGLDRGADEYLFKPVGNRELVARVRAVLRRTDLPQPKKAKQGIIYADAFLTVDIAERKILVEGKRVKLTPREFRLFTLLVKNIGSILTHQQLLEKVWGWEYTNDLDYVRIYISHLRQKIEPDPAFPRYIITEPGVGYYFQKAT